MGKCIFLGKTDIDYFFKALGIEVVEDFKEDLIKDADLILCQDVEADDLEKRYPEKFIIPLVDKKGRFILDEKVKSIVKTTIGER